MQIFVAVAEEKGFAAAGRSLNISPSAVTRFIASMERRIGAQLLSRTTRSLSLTDAGKQYFYDSKKILSALYRAEEIAAAGDANPSGVLKITASVSFGQLYITPHLAEYLDLYPSVQLNAHFLDQDLDLCEKNIDVAVRSGPIDEAEYHAIKIGTMRRVICGSPDYFRRHGRPNHPSELSTANIVVSNARHQQSEWQFLDQGKDLHVRCEPRLMLTTDAAAISIVSEGWGVTRLMSYQVAKQITAGTLELVLEDYEPPAVPLQLVYPKSAKVPAKIRTFVDFLAERLRVVTAFQEAGGV